MPKPTAHEKAVLKDLLRKIVIARDRELCYRCGKRYDLQMSHIYSVGAHKKMEYDEDNLKLLCVRCHLYWWHKNPIDAKEWIESKLSKTRWQRLKLKAMANDHTPFDYKLLKLYLETKLKEYEKR